MRFILTSVTAVPPVELTAKSASSGMVLPFDRHHNCRESSRSSDAVTHHGALLGGFQILLASVVERFFAYNPDLGVDAVNKQQR